MCIYIYTHTWVFKHVYKTHTHVYTYIHIFKVILSKHEKKVNEQINEEKMKSHWITMGSKKTGRSMSTFAGLAMGSESSPNGYDFLMKYELR